MISQVRILMKFFFSNSKSNQKATVITLANNVIDNNDNRIHDIRSI